jgi:hypothetical protein
VALMFSIWYCARHCRLAPMFSIWYCARHCRLALMFSVWYCAGHCSGSYVQYLVLRRTLQWLLFSVSGTAQDTADWLLCSVSGTAQDTAVALMFISPIYVLCSCPIAVLQYCIFCTPVFAVEDTQLAYWFLEAAHSDCVCGQSDVTTNDLQSALT